MYKPPFENEILHPDVRAVMENPSEIVVTLHAIEFITIQNLLSLDFKWARGHRAHCGYPLLCSIPLTLEVAARELRALLDAVDNWDNTFVACFDPRHIFSFDSGGIHYDLLVCYSCQAIRIWRDGECMQSLLSTSIRAEGVEALVVGAGIRRRLDNPE